MTNWQPIETAPRDGTPFVICVADEGLESYEIGSYAPLIGKTFTPVEGGLYRKINTIINEWNGFNNFHKATHWMPLPAPPKPEGE